MANNTKAANAQRAKARKKTKDISTLKAASRQMKHESDTAAVGSHWTIGKTKKELTTRSEAKSKAAKAYADSAKELENKKAGRSGRNKGK